MGKIPQIRFTGYTDEWEEKKLSHLVEFSNGINAPKESYGTGRKMISIMDILSDEPFVYHKIRNSVSVDQKIEKQNKVEQGDLVFVRSSEVLKEVGWVKGYLLTEYALYSGFSIRGKKKQEFDAYFVEQSLNFVNRRQIERKAGGSTRYNVSQSILKDIAFSMPDIAEQNYIAYFLTKINRIIELHQHEHDLLVKTKNSYLQKMFPKTGAENPEIRFREFSDDWKSESLGKVFTERLERSRNGELISVTINSGIVKASELDRKDNSSADKSKYKVVKIGDIAYNSMRMWQGASGYSEYDGILSPAYTVLSPAENIESLFFSYLFKTKNMIQIFRRNSQGLTSDTWNLKFPALSLIKVNVPNYEEQIKIGNFFKQLDETIVLQEKKVIELKAMKKSLLQLMFV